MWIKAEERMPTEEETINGRMPTIDSEGYLRYGLLIDNGRQPPFLMSDTDVVYWMPVTKPE